MTIFRLGISMSVLLAASSAVTTAQAQDAEVVGRLTRHAGMQKAAAKALVGTVSARLRQAADPFADPNDPVRAAMRAAMFGNAGPAAQQNPMNEAKVRLQLYGGLTMGTLTALFRPSPGTLQGCVNSVGLSEAQCEFLMAAAGQISVSKARAASRGLAPAPAVPMAPAPRATVAQTSYPAAPVHRGVQPMAPRPTGVAMQPRPAAPGMGQQPAAAMRQVRPVRPQPTMSTAEAYRARRARYLANFKKRAEARKTARQKGAELAASPAPKPAAQPAPGAATPAPAAATPAPAPTAAAEPVPPADKAAAAPAAAPPPKPAAPAKKDPAMDSLISDLLADPLGKKK